MEGWPENSCLMCDMPWKNNRVLYEGGPPPLLTPKDTHLAAELMLGDIRIRAFRSGRIVVGGKAGDTRCLALGRPIQPGTMAADVALRRLYLSAGRSVLALELETGRIAWKYVLRDAATSPVLYERLREDASVQLLLAVCDQAGGVYALDRESGLLVWQTETGAATKTVPIHQNGRLYVGCQSILACLDAGSGDAIWAAEADGGQATLTQEGLMIGNRLYSPADGSRLR